MRPEPQLSFSDFAVRLNGIVVDAGVKSIKKISEEVSELVSAYYENFFGELYMLVGGGKESMPSRFMGNVGNQEGKWEPLSEAWSDRKLREDSSLKTPLFYRGLTAALSQAKKNTTKTGGGKKRKPRKIRSKKPFDQFLSELEGSSKANVKKMFGDLTIKYYISATGRKTPIIITQRDNIIESISSITSHEGSRRLPNYDNVSLRSDMTLFPALATAREFSEWYVVNQMAEKDKRNRGQWVKINSQYGPNRSRRPIRPIITPLISWYATTLMPSILRKYY